MNKLPIIRHIHYKIAPGGGPHGYLYFLKQALLQWGDQCGINFEITELTEHQPSFLSRLKHRLYSTIFRGINFHEKVSIDKMFKEAVRNWRARYATLNKKIANKLFECDFLFVHDTFLAERLIQLKPLESEQKLLLMTHAPTFYALQIIGDIAPNANQDDLCTEPFVQQIAEQELEVMKAVNTTIWPCEEAQEGYSEWYRLYKSGSVKSLFLETGVPRPKSCVAPSILRQQWGINSSQFIALFMGRPHPHKGFDKFVDIADYCMSRGESKWVFVFAGRKPGIKRNLTSIREVGYQADNGSAYLAADLFLCPNRYSYFDIGVLEAMSLGTKIALAPTGGHKHLIRICPSIPIIPDDKEEAWEHLLIQAAEYRNSSEKTIQFKEIWEKRFSLRSFFENHLLIMQKKLNIVK